VIETQAPAPASFRLQGAQEEPRHHRILLVTEWFLPYVGGSVNLFVNTYGRYPEGQVHVLTGHPLHNIGTEGPPSPMPVTRVSLKRYGFLRPESLMLYIRMTWAAIRLHRSFRPEVVHCGHILPEAPVAWVLKKLFGTPYVVYIHGEEAAIQRHYKWKRRLMPRFYNAAAAVIANSRNGVELLEDLGVRKDRIRVIPLGVDPQRFTPAPRTEDGEIRLLSVGRLQPRKGHAHVLRAMVKLRDRFPRLRYWIAGTGGEKTVLRNLTAELGLEDVVRFLGYVPDEDLPDLYRQCDLFILANRRLSNDDMEGFGIVFLEAAASGLPVIGGITGGVPDAVNDGVNGFLVDTEDIDAIADAVARLVDDPILRRRMSREGRKWAEDHSWELYSRRILALSAEVLPQARAGS